MKKYFLLNFLLGALLCQSCSFMAEDQANASAIANFDALWKDFDQHYGTFQVRNLNWDSVYQVYRPQLSTASGDAELYAVLCQMLNTLDDNHVVLEPTDHRFARHTSEADPIRSLSQDQMSLVVIRDKYLLDYTDAAPEIKFGRLPNQLGYLYIDGFNASLAHYMFELDRALKALADTKGLVLDIRNNSGGWDNIGQYVAGRFAQKPALYMVVKKRNGPRHDQFTAPQEWWMQPAGNFQYTQPIALLTTDFTFSAAETFTLAMKRLPQVTQIGLPTSGAFSDRIVRELPNGWRYSLSIGDYRDHNGKNWESKGLAPDIHLLTTRKKVFEEKVDVVLEKAMEVLR